jgi:ubiquinone/menaquinone biosynthesis C-methylase UbiE
VTLLAEIDRPVATAFDNLATNYDSLFTFSAVGQSQRNVVLKYVLSVFRRGDHILELNCGTGVDALYMVNAGLRVTACDASPRMIEVARKRMAGAKEKRAAQFLTLATEELHKLPNECCFDGLFSNFAGLNCVRDLGCVARDAARRLRPGAPLLLCFLSRFCLWEIVYYLLRGNPRDAFRRCRGASVARVGDFSFPVFYPTLSELRHIFAPEFRLVSTVGVGITVTPSYLEPWIARHPNLLQCMEAIDDLVRTFPGLRLIGDHMLLHFEKAEPC